MKTNLKSILLASVFTLIAVAFTVPKHSITGKWMTHESDGSTSYVDFTSAGKFTYINQGKTIHQGKFKQSDDTFLIDDNECGNGYWAKYKLTFVGEDSVSFAVIDDTCSGRMQTVNGNGLKRMKK